MSLAAIELDGLIQVLAVIAFVVVPILRQVLGGRSKTPAAPTAAPRPRSGERSGWEDLLREQFGVDLRQPEPVIDETGPAEPMAASVPVSSDPPRLQRESASEPPREREIPDELDPFDIGLDGLGDDDRELSEVPSEVGDELATVPSELGDLAFVPSELGATASGDLEDRMRSSRPAAYALSAGQARSSAWLGGDWRRAIVLNEILNGPVALRDGESSLPAGR